MPKQINLEGKRFGRLVVQSRYHGDKKQFYWNCLCDCGTAKTIYGADLKRGAIKSCGCFRREFVTLKKTKHGHAKRGRPTQTYWAWQGMQRRCKGYSPVHKRRYTERGIIVCDRWKKFENFLADMGEKPTGFTLDRINNDGNYEPSNCRWADWVTQRNNRADSKMRSALKAYDAAVKASKTKAKV